MPGYPDAAALFCEQVDRFDEHRALGHSWNG
jgi:hypothetical protein